MLAGMRIIYQFLLVSEVGNLLDCGYGYAALSSSHTRPALLTTPNFQSPIISVICAHKEVTLYSVFKILP